MLVLSCAELEVLLNQVTVIHVLVTVKELLLKCSLGTAVGKYKTKNRKITYTVHT